VSAWRAPVGRASCFWGWRCGAARASARTFDIQLTIKNVPLSDRNANDFQFY
jgi:hypothetical protein